MANRLPDTANRLPDADLARIRSYCETWVPEHATAEIQVDYKVRGRSVTIVERRPPWAESLGPEWSERPIAQLRYDESAEAWDLHCADRDRRWHRYDIIDAGQPVRVVLDEIEDDPTLIFWG